MESVKNKKNCWTCISECMSMSAYVTRQLAAVLDTFKVHLSKGFQSCGIGIRTIIVINKWKTMKQTIWRIK